jgi:hypothetical protein
MNAKLFFFLSCFAAVTLTASGVNADPRSGHRHFSSISPRGGHTFTRSGQPTFGRSTSGTYRNWSGGNWRSGGNWSGGNWSGDWRHRDRFSGGNQFIFSGGFGFPFFYGYPYYGYGSYPYGYSPYGYNYDYYSQPAYGYGYGDQGYGYGDQGYGYGNRSSIAQLQRRLARAGYYRGAIDGIMGPGTRRAIRAYERSYGALGMR